MRFRYRHVHATVFNHVKAQMVALGWGDAGADAGDQVNASVNFGTHPATYIDFQPDEAGKAIAPNTIAVTLGVDPSARDLELGSTYREVAYPIFIDIYGANQAVAMSIATDVKELLEDVYVAVLDYTTSTAGVASDELIEFNKDDVAVELPAAAGQATDIKRYWRVVKTFARVQYLG